MHYCTDIGDQIKKIRLEKNMSQERFGEKIGLSGKAISCYETGRAVPPLEVLERITRTYNTPVILVGRKQKVAVKDKILDLHKQLQELSSMLCD